MRSRTSLCWIVRKPPSLQSSACWTLKLAHMHTQLANQVAATHASTKSPLCVYAARAWARLSCNLQRQSPRPSYTESQRADILRPVEVYVVSPVVTPTLSSDTLRTFSFFF